VSLLLALLALLAGGPSVEARAEHGDAPPGWAPDARAARDYSARRVGEVSFSVRTRRDRWEHRPRMRANSASLIKAMLLVAYLDQRTVRTRALGPADREALEPMIRFSDNESASRVREIVGDGAILRLARRARMRDFRLSAWWGLSQTTAADQSRWWLRLPELTPALHRAYALRLLGSIVGEQRWGIADAPPDGWRLAFKGGWGSGRGAVNHQVALLRRGSQRVALAIITNGSPTHEYGEETLRGVALRLLRGLAEAPRTARAAPRPAAPPQVTDTRAAEPPPDVTATPEPAPATDRDPFTPAPPPP